MFQQESPSWKENVQKADYDNMAALILTSVVETNWPDTQWTYFETNSSEITKNT
jgi:hypothetical protein